MEHIILPEEGDRRLVFYLAMEEFVARNVGEDAFFLWRVAPTVIIGRNQSLEDEVDTGYCAENGVQVYRRKSGGGCVYADKGNLMISAVTGIHGTADAFGSYLSHLNSFWGVWDLIPPCREETTYLLKDARSPAMPCRCFRRKASCTGRFSMMLTLMPCGMP